MDRLQYHDILYNEAPLGPWPTHLLKRVEEPTNKIVGPIARSDQRETAFSEFLALGAEDEEGKPSIERMIGRFPLGAALLRVKNHLALLREGAEVGGRSGRAQAGSPGGGVKTRRSGGATAFKKAPFPGEPRARSRHLKALGYFLGADLMGIAPLDPSAVYAYDEEGRPIELHGYKSAVVFVCQKHDPTFSASNGWEDVVDAVSFQAYVRLAVQTEVMAEYLRRLGWKAEVSNITRYLTVMPRLLLDAGLGEVSRMGIILNPFIGCNYKAACVLTDMELESDGYVDFGLQRYCGRCTLCADQCPAQAIPRGPKRLYNGYYAWKIDSRRCAEFAARNREGFICGRCTKVCPWHIPGQQPHDFAGWDGSVEWLHQRVDRQRERVIADGFVDSSEKTGKWWLPLEEVSGRIVAREWPVPDSNR